MVYKITVFDKKKLPFPESNEDGILATADIELDSIVRVQGINIRQKENNGYLFVEMPNLEDVYSRTVVNNKTKYAAIPTTKDFAKELYSNIIKTYMSDSQVMDININEPDKTEYKISVHSTDNRDYEGIIDIELEDSVKLRGLKLKRSYNGEYFVDYPIVKSGDYSIPAFEFTDENFKNHIIKNSVMIIEERRVKHYSDDDKAEYMKIEKGIYKEESDIRLCDRMLEKFCLDMSEIDDKLEFNNQIVPEKRNELIESQKKLNDMLGQFTYARYCAESNLNRYMSLKEEIKKKYENKIQEKKKGGGGR